MAGSLGVLGPGDRGLVLVAATATTAANGACLRIALGPNFRNRETKRENARNGSVVSERRETSDVSVLEALVVAAPDPGPGPGSGITTTIGLSNETLLENTEASKMTTTTSNRGTMLKDRDKRLLSPGIK